ncbi:MAG: DUF4922 domain-containing protein [Deltaproteobacteria bacterium]|nr:DUF4922 domain-containing protein [Deltaproteobacteria bacterium]
MSWAERIASGAPPGLAGFHAWQVERWPRLREAIEGLPEVRTRTIDLPDRPATVQFNPGRTASSTASVDASSVAARPCFLCPENLPAEEQGLAFGADLVVLANPAPIGPLHFVVAQRAHRPQALQPVLDDAVALAVAFPEVAVFYNGPRCGASAPDHIHLQAIGRGVMPDEERFSEALRRNRDPAPPLARSGTLRTWYDQRLRTTLYLAGPPASVAAGVRDAVAALAEVTETDEEPMLNLVLASVGDRLGALLYPRGAHRPACYFAPDPERCLVSPGAVDMAGGVIAVREIDFGRLDAGRLTTIFAETSLSPAAARRWEGALARRLSDA